MSARQNDATIRVLLVEDNPGDVRLVEEMLAEDEQASFALAAVPTVRDALERLASPARTDAVLLDLSLPDESGLSTVERVVAGARGAVVVVMTGAGDEELGMAAMQAGAQDYLVKGQVTGSLLRRALRFAMGRQALRQQLQDMSLKDDLTGLNNRRGFLILAEQQVRVARRERRPFLLIFVDLDGLKGINDTFGHAEGNRALVEAADVLRESLRYSDVLARFGGDEFGACCLCSGAEEVEAVRARIAARLAHVNAASDRLYPLGFSIGTLYCEAGDGTNIEVLLERADRLMYEDKRRRGRTAKPVDVRV